MRHQLPLAGKSILIIEDEPLIALEVEYSLKEAGAGAIEIAGSVAQAKSAITSGVAFDTVVVDLHLSDGDANPLLAFLSRRGIPVVVTTGYSIDDLQPDLKQAIAVLQKPYRATDLIETVKWLTKADGLPD